MNKPLMASLVVAMAGLAAANDSSNYVRDGLVLQFDAIDNAGAGQHSDNPTVWKDLSGNGHDLTLPAAAKMTVGKDVLTFNKAQVAVVVPELVESANTEWTLEVVVRASDEFVPSGFCYFVQSMRAWLFFRELESKTCGIGSVCRSSDGKRYYRGIPKWCSNWNNVPFMRHFHTYSARTSEAHAPDGQSIAIDGGLYISSQTTGNEASQSVDDSVIVGNSSYKFHYRAIRLYKRHLTEDEMRQNAAEDARRFPSETDADAPANPFSDAVWYFRGPTGEDDATLGAADAKNALWTGATTSNPADSIAIQGPADNVKVRTMDVVCPYSGKMLRNQKVLDFVQAAWEEGGVKKASVSYCSTSVPGNYTNMAPYTVFLRFRLDSTMAPGVQSEFLSLGYQYSNESGLCLQLRGDDDSNMYVYARHGTNADQFKGMLTSPAHAIKKGKWIDFALTVDGRDNWLYYQSEDGEFYSERQNTAIVTSRDTRDHVLNLGGTVSKSSDLASNLYNFRGQIHQVGIWSRCLSEAEVRQAFCGGCAKGDAVRVGVPNGSACEFSGVGDVDADASNGWMGMKNGLATVGESLRIAFDLPQDVGFGRTFRFTSTPWSQDGATLRVSLNGCPIAESLSVPAGKTATAPVDSAFFRPTGNVLTVERTDAGAQSLEIDCLALTAGGGSSGTEPTGKVTEYDVYSGAWCWYRNPVDDDQDGYLFADTTTSESDECRDELRVSDPTDERHHWLHGSVVKGSNFRHVRETVVFPAAGMSVADEPCIRFVNPTVEEDGVLKATWGGMLRTMFPVTNEVGYSALVRFKLDAFQGDNHVAELMGTGYEWANKRGSAVRLQSDPDNMSVRINCGTTGLVFDGTTTGASENRLQAGKWIDLGYTVSNGWFRLYTCVEGGAVVEQLLFGGAGCLGTPAASSELRLGSMSGGGKAKSSNPDDFLGFQGLVHHVAVWPRTLTDKEMRLAMSWPKPDIFHVGTANGSRKEFAGGENPFAVRTSGASREAGCVVGTKGTYTVNFDVGSSETVKNQRLIVSTTAEGEDASFEVRINGEKIVNYASDRSEISTLDVAAGASTVFGVRKGTLKTGANTLTITRVDDNAGLVYIDAVSLGNCGDNPHVRSGDGIIIFVR